MGQICGELRESTKKVYLRELVRPEMKTRAGVKAGMIKSTSESLSVPASEA